MEYGPLHLVALNFDHAALPDVVLDNTQRFQDDGLLRIVDAVSLFKDNQGELNEVGAGDLTRPEGALSGILARALFGNGDQRASNNGNPVDSGTLASEQGEFGISVRDIDEIVDLMPRGGTTTLILIEHLWAIGFKEVVHKADGVVVAHGLITPKNLIEIGDARDVDEYALFSRLV